MIVIVIYCDIQIKTKAQWVFLRQWLNLNEKRKSARGVCELWPISRIAVYLHYYYKTRLIKQSKLFRQTVNHEKESQKSNQWKVSVIWATEAGKQFTSSRYQDYLRVFLFVIFLKSIRHSAQFDIYSLYQWLKGPACIICVFGCCRLGS